MDIGQSAKDLILRIFSNYFVLYSTDALCKLLKKMNEETYNLLKHFVCIDLVDF